MSAHASNAPITSIYQLPEGQYTKTIYGYLRDQNYRDVIRLLSTELMGNDATSSQPALNAAKTRALQSLLAYAYYHSDEYEKAAECYEALSALCPDVDEYRLYQAQCLFQCSKYAQVQKICQNITKPELAHTVLQLQAVAKCELNDMAAFRAYMDQCKADDTETMVNQGCLLQKEGKYEEACRMYIEVLKITGYQADVSYNLALCYYNMKVYEQSLKYIADIIERGIRDHPELSIGMATEGFEVRHVANSLLLHETHLIEAFNLKAAIEYQLRNFDAAKEALTDMPPRQDLEIDSVTLHNQAIMNMSDDPTIGFEKLNFLLYQTPCPPTTVGNLLLLYIKYEYYDHAADMLAEHAHVAHEYLTQYLLDYIEAALMRSISPEDSFNTFDEMGNKHIDGLRKLAKRVQDARVNGDDDNVKLKLIHEYDEAVEQYIPVLMAQAKIFWDQNNYVQVEKIFRKSVEFCNEHDVWKLNVAHTLFMQETKFKEAISFYEPIVKKNYDNLLNVTAIVLANLCVSYIMTSQNEEAEELMRRIDKEEERVAFEEPQKRIFHLCIVNLVIGTLYCSKGNYEFGISRVMKSLEPFNKKLGTDTWFYAKRCILSLLETLSKHMLVLKDSVFAEILHFLDQCELHGQQVPTIVDPLAQRNGASQAGGYGAGAAAASPAMAIGRSELDLSQLDGADDGSNHVVAYEARLLKSLFLRLYGV